MSNRFRAIADRHMSAPSPMRKVATFHDADPKHPIVSVELSGGVIAQGPTVDEADTKRGSLPIDMHGKLSIDAGGKIVAGKPIPSIRGVPVRG